MKRSVPPVTIREPIEAEVIHPNPLMDRILKNRGVSSTDELAYNLSGLLAPEMRGLDTAVAIIGKHLLAGVVTPWLKARFARPTSCNYSLMATEATYLAKQAGFDTTKYQKFVYVFPSLPGCGWAGLGGGSLRHIGGERTPQQVALELLREITEPGLRDLSRQARPARIRAGEF